MNKGLIATLVLLGVASVYLYTLESITASKTEVYSFEQYKKEFGKRYTKDGEELYRKNIFLRNLIAINEHNANPKNTYTMGVNQFTDLTQAEFESIYLTLKVPKRSYKEIDTTEIPKVNADVDWTVAERVTDVKNQGQCGSCWAFSATASFESAILIAHGAKFDVSLSEQQLVDCAGGKYGNQGCNGGWMDSAFDYIIDNGITESEDYPYVARDQACKKNGGIVKMKGYTDTPGCTDLVNALAARPISVAVDASNWSPYRSGILSSCGKNVNHGVLLVGVSDTFWKIKNSWGTSWGDKGFIRISPGNTCAVCSYPSYPIFL